MKKIILMFSIIAFISSYTSILPAAENRMIIGRGKISEGKNEIDVAIMRIGQGKAAAIIDIPIKSDARIENAYLKSPSGKQYKAISVTPVQASKMNAYFDSFSVTKSSMEKISDFLVPEAYASCGSCGGGGKSGNSCDGGAAHDDGSGVSYGQLMSLFGAAMGDASRWLTVCIFDIVEEPGIWEFILKYYTGGKSGRAAAKIQLIGAGTVTGLSLPEGQSSAGKIRVDSGMALDCTGNDIVVREGVVTPDNVSSEKAKKNEP